MKQMEKGVQEYRKDESPDSYDTTSTSISRQFSFEKRDRCKKYQDLSLQWQ